ARSRAHAPAEVRTAGSHLPDNAVEALGPPDPDDRFIDEWRSKQLLRALDVDVAPGALVTSADEAVAGAAQLGLPVVLKLVGADLPHKAAVGGLRLDLH